MHLSATITKRALKRGERIICATNKILWLISPHSYEVSRARSPQLNANATPPHHRSCSRSRTPYALFHSMSHGVSLTRLKLTAPPNIRATLHAQQQQRAFHSSIKLLQLRDFIEPGGLFSSPICFTTRKPLQHINNNNNNHKDDDEKAVIVRDLQEMKPGNEVFVVLIGWLGAHPKHLSKYSQWYSACNADVISIIPSPVNLFSSTRSQREVSRFLQHFKRIVVEKQQQPSPSAAKGSTNRNNDLSIVFHCLSGNGAFFLAELLREVMRNEEYATIRSHVLASIFDSGPPSKADAAVFARGFVFAAFPSLANRVNDDEPQPLILRLAIALAARYLNRPEIAKRFESVQEEAVRAYTKIGSSLMFLYSDADVVVPASDIQSFIGRVKHQLEKEPKRNAHVQEVNFTNSPHVQHFRYYPRMYSKVILDFVQATMMTSTPQQQ